MNAKQTFPLGANRPSTAGQRGLNGPMGASRPMTASWPGYPGTQQRPEDLRGGRAARGGGDGADSEATRLLCVAAHQDREFGERVIREVLEEEHRAVCPSYGIDLVPIIRHCLAARRRRTGRDALLLAVVVVGLVVQPLLTFVMASTAYFWFGLYRLVTGWPRRSLSRNVLLVGALLAGFWLLSTILAVVAPSFGGVLLASSAISGGPRLLAFLILFVAVFGIVFVERARARDVLVRTLSARAFDPGAAPRASSDTERRLRRLADEQYGNVTVYSRYSPFVGAGLLMEAWSFAVDLARPAERPERYGFDGGPPADPVPIRVADLQRWVTERLSRLGDLDLHAGDRLTGLRLERQVFVNGRAVRGREAFLPDPKGAPTIRIDESVLERIAHEPTGPVRQYLCVRAGSWEEELVVSVFLHMATTGRTLFLETTWCLLRPIKPEYHAVDTMPVEMTPGALLELLKSSLLTVVPAFCAAPVELAAVLLSPLRQQIRRRSAQAAIREDLGFDYGSETSVRELGMADRYDNYFQRLDADKFQKLVELHVFQAVVDFLDARGVDTSTLRQRQVFIQNSHTIFGDVSAGAVAVGAGATATNIAGQGQAGTGGK
jgi:hypothetical protein